jgi:alginate O-acetyltransferase complex protein AlgI
MVGWVFFRADTLPGALAFLAAMGGRDATAPTPFTLQWFLTPMLWLALAAGIVGSMPIGPLMDRWRVRSVERGEDARLSWGLSLASVGAIALVLVAAIVQIAARTYNPFIYFRF